jgi:hypothetical protein
MAFNQLKIKVVSERNTPLIPKEPLKMAKTIEYSLSLQEKVSS